MTLCDLVDMSHVRKESADTISVNSSYHLPGQCKLILEALITKIVTLIFQLQVCSKHGYPDAGQVQLQPAINLTMPPPPPKKKTYNSSTLHVAPINLITHLTCNHEYKEYENYSQ
jgi:hypothetical protein